MSALRAKYERIHRDGPVSVNQTVPRGCRASATGNAQKHPEAEGEEGEACKNTPVAPVHGPAFSHAPQEEAARQGSDLGHYELPGVSALYVIASRSLPLKGDSCLVSGTFILTSCFCTNNLFYSRGLKKPVAFAL